MKFDIAIIGASSSGLYAAGQLARAGLRVGVFEQQSKLEPARRTLIVTPALRRWWADLSDEAVLHRIPVMAVATANAALRVTLEEPDLIIERYQFARLLANRAQEAGSEIYFGYNFHHMEPQSAGVAIHLRSSSAQAITVSSRAVIGADGAFSAVAAAAGLNPPPTVPILQAEVRLPHGWDPDVTQVWFDTDDTRYFYWLIPESVERGVVGLVGDNRKEMRGLLQRFLTRHGLQPLTYQGAMVAIHHPRLRPWTRVGAAPVLLVGDAAGQVKVSTVGGTVSGLWGAQAAASALLRGSHYGSELRPLKRELDLHWLIRWALERLDNTGYDRLVRCITPQLQRFLGRHNRDQMAGAFWQAPLLEPRLLLLGAQFLRRRSNTLLLKDNAAVGD